MRTTTLPRWTTVSGSWLARALQTTAFVAVCLVPSAALAQSAKSFAGSWVEDQAKRTIGSLRNLTFRQAADGGLEELRGSYSNPLAQPVRFDGRPYVVDGSRNTIAWKQTDPTHFERTISQNNQVINTRRIQVSADGSTLTEATENSEGTRKSVTTIVYRRMSGSGPGLAGVWKPQSRKSDSPDTLRVEETGAGLRVFANEGRSTRTTYALTFDGKVAQVDGPATISGTAVAGKLVNDRTIEIAQSRSGVATGRTTWSLSADGKLLTATVTGTGPDATPEPSIIVYSRR